jgi:hypothetical protein
MASVLHNMVVLRNLAELDILAALPLINASSSLCHFILDTIVSVPMVCRFLRENQYALLHDTHHTQFSSHDIILLARAITALQGRHNNDELYKEIRDYLGILLARTPKGLLLNPEMLCQEDLRHKNVGREDELSQRIKHAVYTTPFGNNWWDKRLLRREEMKELGKAYAAFLSSPQLNPLRERSEGNRHFYLNFLTTGKSRHPYLREHIFFCGHYINDVILTESKCKALFWDNFHDSTGPIFSKETSVIVAKFIRFNDQLLENGSKIFIPEYLRRDLVSELIDKWFEHRGKAIAFGNRTCARGIPSADEIFTRLFESQLWNETETPADFGWWLAKSRICLDKISITNFASKREAVAWVLLGSHYSKGGFGFSINRCCSSYSTTRFDKKLLDVVLDLSLEDRVSTVKMIIYRASEFGVCTNLGAALLYFFAFRAKDHEMDVILSVIFREVVQSSRVRNLLGGMARSVKEGKWDIPASLLRLPLEQTQVHISRVRSKFQDFGALLEIFTRTTTKSNGDLSSHGQ